MEIKDDKVARLWVRRRSSQKAVGEEDTMVVGMGEREGGAGDKD